MARHGSHTVPTETKDNHQECTCFAVTFIFGPERNRLSGAFCDVHQSVDSDEENSSPLPARNPVPMTRTPVTSGPNLSAVLPVLTLDGFAWRFQLDDDSLAALEREIDPISTADSRKCRDIYRFDSTVLPDVVAAIAQRYPAQLGRFTPMIPQGAAPIVAAPYSQRNPSEQFKLGRLYRDTAGGDPGYLTMLAFHHGMAPVAESRL
jgi:hypothetical protein